MFSLTWKVLLPNAKCDPSMMKLQRPHHLETVGGVENSLNSDLTSMRFKFGSWRLLLSNIKSVRIDIHAKSNVTIIKTYKAETNLFDNLIITL